MNLREIGVLLVFLYVLTVLLMTYKYYNAKGRVFQVSNWLVFKYLFRFLSFVSLLFICYNVILSHQTSQKQSNTKASYLIVVSAENSSITWKNIQNKILELPSDGEFGLLLFEPRLQKWVQIIPSTNQDSFLHLLEHAQESQWTQERRLFQEPISAQLNQDDFSILTYRRNHWENIDSNTLSTNSNAKNVFLGWVQSSNVPLYLVILLLVLTFIDIVFPIKALKI